MRENRTMKHDNETIQAGWDAALEVLKPGQKEIEHGLELHRESLVFESYGFSPAAALDNAVLAEAMEAGASNLELKDLREDMSMTRKATDPAERKEMMAAWDIAGVTCILQNAGEEGQSAMRLIKRLARYTFTSDMLRDFCPRAVGPDDIVAAHEQGRHCFYMSLNGVPLPEDWVSVEEELRYVKIFFQLGARMMHLTYNRRNMIGDGCAELANGGLSDFGRAAVAEMNRVGVIADVAHSGWQTALEAAQVSEKPIMASHSVCCALHNHPRGKPDEVIRAIVDGGGVMGICCIPTFLGGSGNISAFLDHVDHVVKTFGADHVSIGTDVGYRSRNSDKQKVELPPRRPGRPRWEGFWPPHVPSGDTKYNTPENRLTMEWTNWPLFTVGMVQRGHSDDDIRKMLGENVLRVCRDVLPEDMPLPAPMS